MKPKIVLIGAGGHGRVLIDAILSQNKYEIVGFVDTALSIGTVISGNYKVILLQNELHKLDSLADFFIISIGNNSTREKLYNEAEKYIKPAIIIHPTATICPNVIIEDGTVIMAKTFINTSCTIGKNTIVNAGVIIDHDCKIGNHVHLSIGTLVGSRSIIFDKTTTTIGQHINSFSNL